MASFTISEPTGTRPTQALSTKPNLNTPSTSLAPTVRDWDLSPLNYNTYTIICNVPTSFGRNQQHWPPHQHCTSKTWKANPIYLLHALLPHTASTPGNILDPSQWSHAPLLSLHHALGHPFWHHSNCRNPKPELQCKLHTLPCASGTSISRHTLVSFPAPFWPLTRDA